MSMTPAVFLGVVRIATKSSKSSRGLKASDATTIKVHLDLKQKEADTSNNSTKVVAPAKRLELKLNETPGANEHKFKTTLSVIAMKTLDDRKAVKPTGANSLTTVLRR